MKKCETCKHFQLCGDLLGAVNVGTCRNQPPKQCITCAPTLRSAEPLYPSVDPLSECSIWAPDSRLFQGLAASVFGSPVLGFDNDMEAANTNAWTAANATLSKQVGTPHGGTRCLRVAYNGSHTTGYATQYAAFYHPFKSAIFQISGYCRSDGTALPIVKVFNVDGDSIFQFNGTDDTDWQHFTGRFAWPDAEDTLDQDGIYYQLALGSDTLDTGLYCEFDDIQITQAVLKKPMISCWDCKHFQPLYIQGSLTRMGECRVQPPLQPTPSPGNEEPIFAGLIDASAFWCSAWQRSNHGILTLPAMPTTWPYNNVSPPPIYPYTPE